MSLPEGVSSMRACPLSAPTLCRRRALSGRAPLAGSIERFAYDRPGRFPAACSGGLLAGTRALADLIARRWRTGSLRLGYSCVEASGGRADVHAEGRALDWRLDAGSAHDRAIGDAIVRWLLADDRAGNRHARAPPHGRAGDRLERPRLDRAALARRPAPDPTAATAAATGSTSRSRARVRRGPLAGGADQPLELVRRALHELAHLVLGLAEAAQHVRRDDLGVGRVGAPHPTRTRRKSALPSPRLSDLRPLWPARPPPRRVSMRPNGRSISSCTATTRSSGTPSAPRAGLTALPDSFM